MKITTLFFFFAAFWKPSPNQLTINYRSSNSSWHTNNVQQLMIQYSSKVKLGQMCMIHSSDQSLTRPNLTLWTNGLRLVVLLVLLLSSITVVSFVLSSAIFPFVGFPTFGMRGPVSVELAQTLLFVSKLEILPLSRIRAREREWGWPVVVLSSEARKLARLSPVMDARRSRHGVDKRTVWFLHPSTKIVFARGLCMATLTASLSHVIRGVFRSSS